MEKCQRCEKELKEISEKYVVNHYVQDEDGYILLDSTYENVEYSCGNCGSEITGTQLERIKEQIK
jgi:DNA-directed RNA polymerase subunit RPC12/RpoP